MHRSVFHWLAQNRDCRIGKTKNQLSRGGGGGGDHYKSPLAFYCCFLVLYRTASKTVTGHFFIAISQLSRRRMIGVKVGLHDAAFYGFPYKLRPKPKIGWRLPVYWSNSQTKHSWCGNEIPLVLLTVHTAVKISCTMPPSPHPPTRRPADPP